MKGENTVSLLEVIKMSWSTCAAGDHKDILIKIHEPASDASDVISMQCDDSIRWQICFQLAYFTYILGKNTFIT